MGSFCRNPIKEIGSLNFENNAKGYFVGGIHFSFFVKGLDRVWLSFQSRHQIAFGWSASYLHMIGRDKAARMTQSGLENLICDLGPPRNISRCNLLVELYN